MLEPLRRRARSFSIPAQVLGVLLTFLAAVVWLPMWAVVLNVLDILHMREFGVGLHWINWAGLWLTALCRVAVWAIYELFDLDGSGS